MMPVIVISPPRFSSVTFVHLYNEVKEILRLTCTLHGMTVKR